jgi:hypothetical protein
VGIINTPYSFTGGMSGGGYGKLDLKLSYAAPQPMSSSRVSGHTTVLMSIEFLAYSPLMMGTIGLLPRPLATQDSNHAS